MRIFFRITFLILLLFISTIQNGYTSSIPSHHIRLEFDLKSHAMKGVDTLKMGPNRDGRLTFSIHKNISITSIKIAGGSKLHFSIEDAGKDKKTVTISPHYPVKGEIEIEIEYTGGFAEFPGDIKFSREFLSDKPVAYVGEDIILLDGSSCWYPCMNEYAAFNVTAVTPQGYEVVMEGTRLSRKEADGVVITTWDFPYPASGIYFVGGKYNIVEDKYNDIPIYAYLFPEDINLASTYIEHTKKYLSLYERLFGKYPFGKFAVVENILPTGFGMPSYTLLGQSVIRLPFIVKTSLGHEIAHNWWGNYVYPDYESGNWSEGLTTYIADHLYDDMDGKGAVYRSQLLRDYTTYVKPAEDYPLTRFKGRIGPDDRAIGYGKGAYVFHMLRVMLGDDIFYDSLRYVIAHRGFKVTSWGDFMAAFEKVSGKNLGLFFRQWVEEGDAPRIILGNVTVSKVSKDGDNPPIPPLEKGGKGGFDRRFTTEQGYVIKAEIIQKERPYEIYLPVLVETDGNSILTYHWVKNLDNILEINVSSKPRSITIDPHYDVFRRLNPEEVPPTLSKFMSSKDRLVILPSLGEKGMLDAYAEAASIMESDRVKKDKEVSEEDLRKNFICIIGGSDENRWADRLNSKLPPSIKIEKETISINGKSYDKKEAVLVVVIENPYNPDKVMLFLSGYNPEYIVPVGKRLGHYGKYSYLLFVRGENVEKGTWETGKLEKTLD